MLDYNVSKISIKTTSKKTDNNKTPDGNNILVEDYEKRTLFQFDNTK